MGLVASSHREAEEDPPPPPTGAGEDYEAAFPGVEVGGRGV